MTWTVNHRGTAAAASTSTGPTIASFTSTSGNLLVLSISHNGGSGSISSISGHGTWSRIAENHTAWSGTRSAELWACISGGATATVVLTYGQYINKLVCTVEELAETAGFDATVANNFGTLVYDSGNLSDPTGLSCSVAAFAASTHLSFGSFYSESSVAGHIVPGTDFTELNEYNDGVTTGYSIEVEYQTVEDSPIDWTTGGGIGSTECGAFGVEIKHQAAAGGTVIERTLSSNLNVTDGSPIQ